jgi:hypothetical protein
MKNFFTIFLSISFCVSLNAQKIYNYDGVHSPDKSVNDFLEISVEALREKPTPPRMPAFAGLFPFPVVSSLIGPIGTLSIDIINSSISKRQQSFTATYSNNISIPIVNSGDKSSDKLFYSDLLEEKCILILRRYKLNDINQTLQANDIMAEYKFNFSMKETGSIQITLDSVKLIKSKARFKNDENLSIGIDFKLGIMSKSSDSKESPDQDLGESIIKIPMIKIGKFYVSQGRGTGILNEKLINHAFFKSFAKPAKDNEVILNVSVTVTEANINHLQPRMVDNLLKNNGDDIVSVLKAILAPDSKSN